MGPLAGLRVLDMTSVLMGPQATQILGDFGAEVIKVEPPAGDTVRQVGPFRHEGMGPLFLNSNHSKKSIVLDIKAEAGRRALDRLIAEADILVSNIRPKAMARLGLSYANLQKLNPALIYASLVGFDQRGPYAARPAYDDLIQGGACISYCFVRAGQTPSYVPAAVADRIVGFAASNAILAAVIERQSSGEGQKVEIPMFETMVSMILSDHLGGLTYEPPLDKGGYARQLSPERRPYRTKDGYICALIYNDEHWRRFFKAIDRPHVLETDTRFGSFASRMAHIDEVYAELAKILLTRTTDEWLTLLEMADVPAMPMHSFESVMEDPHLVATGFFQTVEHPTEGPIRVMSVPTQFSRSQPGPRRLAPRLGQDGIEILSDVRMGPEEIAELERSGALQVPNQS